MSKEQLKASQFRKAEPSWSDDALVLSAEQKADLESLYGGAVVNSSRVIYLPVRF